MYTCYPYVLGPIPVTLPVTYVYLLPLLGPIPVTLPATYTCYPYVLRRSHTCYPTCWGGGKYQLFEVYIHFNKETKKE